jgi:hypothetical protein
LEEKETEDSRRMDSISCFNGDLYVENHEKTSLVFHEIFLREVSILFADGRFSGFYIQI